MLFIDNSYKFVSTDILAGRPADARRFSLPKISIHLVLKHFRCQAYYRMKFFRF